MNRSELVRKIIDAYDSKIIGRDTPDVETRKRKDVFVVEWKEEMRHLRGYPAHHACQNCLVCLPATKETPFDLSTMQLKLVALKSFKIKEVTISVPGGPTFDSFRNALQNKNLTTLRDLKWVFIPTYNRSRRALLHFSHLLERGSTFKPLFALVVRKSEFEAYQNVWGRFHVIVQLPTRFTLPPSLQKRLNYKEDDYVTDDKHRIGFSRLFMQLFAHALGLSFAFHMDDNVSSLYCIDFAESKGDQIKMKKTYLTKVLSHLWNQFDPKAEIPKELRSPHCTKVFDYSGEPDMYGMLGMKFDRLGYKRPPFRHARLAALYLLNVKATVEKNVFFMPTPFLEDVMFCDDCDSEGLLCCKYGRFVFVKALVEGADKFTTSGVKSFREPKTAVSVRGPLERATLSAESDVILSTEPQTAEASSFFAEDVAASGVEQELDVIHNSDSSEKKEGAVTSDSLGELTLSQLECRCRD